MSVGKLWSGKRHTAQSYASPPPRTNANLPKRFALHPLRGAAPEISSGYGYILSLTLGKPPRAESLLGLHRPGPWDWIRERGLAATTTPLPFPTDLPSLMGFLLAFASHGCKPLPTIGTLVLAAGSEVRIHKCIIEICLICYNE